MTHAALKDLLPCPFCGKSCAVLSNTHEMGRPSVCFMYAVVCDATADGCGATGGYHDEATDAITAWNRRAAISAMEGEAVEPIGWVYQHEETGRMTFCTNDGINTPEVFQRLNPGHILCGPAYTAPPPQQAEKDFEFGGYCGTCGSPCDGQGRSIHGHASTHPTPSPGPQGGGDVHVRHVGGGLLALYRGNEQVREIGVTPGWNFRDRDEFIVRYNATPPAHQPGDATPPQPEAQVTDAMVEAARSVLESYLPHWSDESLRKIATNALTAALTTSGRDGDA